MKQRGRGVHVSDCRAKFNKQYEVISIKSPWPRERTSLWCSAAATCCRSGARTRREQSAGCVNSTQSPRGRKDVCTHMRAEKKGRALGSQDALAVAPCHWSKTHQRRAQSTTRQGRTVVSASLIQHAKPHRPRRSSRGRGLRSFRPLRRRRSRPPPPPGRRERRRRRQRPHRPTPRTVAAGAGAGEAAAATAAASDDGAGAVRPSAGAEQGKPRGGAARGFRKIEIVIR